MTHKHTHVNTTRNISSQRLAPAFSRWTASHNAFLTHVRPSTPVLWTEVLMHLLAKETCSTCYNIQYGFDLSIFWYRVGVYPHFGETEVYISKVIFTVKLVTLYRLLCNIGKYNYKRCHKTNVTKKKFTTTKPLQYQHNPFWITVD